MIHGAHPAFFEGLTSNEAEAVERSLELRHFPAGSTLIAEGDIGREMYVIEAGTAHVFVSDGHGVQHRIASAGPGTTLGEVALLAKQPATGTVRAATDVDVLVLGLSELERLGRELPRIHFNLGAILSYRLARASRLSVGGAPRRVAVLEEAGAHPLLGYALACSVAWHARRPTLLLVLDAEPPHELAACVREPAEDVFAYRRRPGLPDDAAAARLAVVAPTGASASTSLSAAVEHLRDCYEFIFVHARGLPPPELSDAIVLRVAASGSGNGATITGWTSPFSPTIEIPELSPADVAALAEGQLPATTAAGRALGLAGRRIAGLTVGLALGAGSVRGYAHAGALEMLERVGVPVDYLAGTSIGAAIAALYATGRTPDEIAATLDRYAATVFRPTLPIHGLLSNTALKRTMRMLGDIRIEDLPVPLAVVAADIAGKREVVFRRGLLWQAVLASTAIPGVFPAQRVGPYTLVDGGVLNPVPASAAAEMGADIVVAVKLGGGAAEPELDAAAVEARESPPPAVSVMVRSIELLQSRIATDAGVPTVTIAPTLDGGPAKLRNFSEGRRYVGAGAAAVEAALPRLAAAFPWLRAAAGSEQAVLPADGFSTSAEVS